jgi:hypothetical protein
MLWAGTGEVCHEDWWGDRGKCVAVVTSRSGSDKRLSPQNEESKAKA